MALVELILWFIFIGSVAMYWLNSNPEINWKCRFGNHDYSYVGKKSGMVRNSSGGGVIGTMRKVYKCHCGEYKPAESEDYIH